MESSRRATANLLVWGCQAKARTVQPALEGGQGRVRPPNISWAGKDPSQSPQRNKTSFLLLNGTIFFEKFPISGNYLQGSAEGIVTTAWGWNWKEFPRI